MRRKARRAPETASSKFPLSHVAVFDDATPHAEVVWWWPLAEIERTLGAFELAERIKANRDRP